MRRVLAVIAAVMSVATGGPLRCPCQLAALFLDGSSSRETSARIPPPAPPSHPSGCKCQGHVHDDEPAPTEERRDHPEPCNHGPGVDLLTPATADRQAGDSGSDGHAVAVSHFVPALSVVTEADAPARPLKSDFSPPDCLRFCHAFRC